MAVLAIAVLGGAYAAHRVNRVVRMAQDLRSQIRYLIENGGTIGQMPSEQTFSLDFLQAIFGDDPDLLAKIEAVISKGLADEPALNVGEVAAMMVTYRTGDDGKAEDVVIHAIGGFSLIREKPGFHRGGYFFQQLDRNLWTYGNMIISFLGRDIVLFAADEQITSAQEDLIDSMFSGEITNLVEYIRKPLRYTMVLPAPQEHHAAAAEEPRRRRGRQRHAEPPRRLLGHDRPRQVAGIRRVCPVHLRRHEAGGRTGPPHALGRRGEKHALGPRARPMVAYEMAQALHKVTLEKDENLVHMRTSFERVMVNAVLKVTSE